MSNYELSIKFSEEALKAIYAAGERLIVTKEVSGSKGSSVCWVSTLPFMNNTIKWSEEYMLYASREEAMNGATIEKLSDVDAIAELVYDFKAGTFDNARTSGGVGKNEYGVSNQMDQYDVLTFGLAQKVDVNGTQEEGRPINAVTLPFNHTASFSPIERVRVFLAVNVNNGMVITREFSNSIDVTYTGTEVSKTIAYDDTKGMFIPVN
ncbi:MAG: hypothetical protein ACI4AQ_08235 [Lachnospiraceae bacterium]